MARVLEERAESSVQKSSGSTIVLLDTSAHESVVGFPLVDLQLRLVAIGHFVYHESMPTERRWFHNPVNDETEAEDQPTLEKQQEGFYRVEHEK